MEETQVLESTQALPNDWDLSEENHPVMGWLDIMGTKHQLVLGENKIGRDPVTCAVVLSGALSISKEHAVLEVEAGGVTLYDLASRNRTRINKLMLKPHVRYGLSGGETLRFGDLQATYFIKEEVIADSDDDDTISNVSMMSRLTTASPDDPINLLDPLSDSGPLLAHRKNNTSGNDSVEVAGKGALCKGPPESNIEGPHYSLEKKSPAKNTLGAQIKESRRSNKSNHDSSVVHPSTSVPTSTSHFASVLPFTSPTNQFNIKASPLKKIGKAKDSPSSKSSLNTSYNRMCFFMPAETTKTTIGESDDEEKKDVEDDDGDDFDESIISPTPCPSVITSLFHKSIKTAVGCETPNALDRLSLSPAAGRPTPKASAVSKTVVPETPCSSTPPSSRVAWSSDVASPRLHSNDGADIQQTGPHGSHSTPLQASSRRFHRGLAAESQPNARSPYCERTVQDKSSSILFGSSPLVMDFAVSKKNTDTSSKHQQSAPNDVIMSYNSDVSTDEEDENGVSRPISGKEIGVADGKSTVALANENVHDAPTQMLPIDTPPKLKEVPAMDDDVFDTPTQVMSLDHSAKPPFNDELPQRIFEENSNSYDSDVATCTQDVLTAFGDDANNSNETVSFVGNETQDILSAFDHTFQATDNDITLQKKIASDTVFKKPFTTPARPVRKSTEAKKIPPTASADEVDSIFDQPTQQINYITREKQTGLSSMSSNQHRGIDTSEMATQPFRGDITEDDADDYSIAPTQPYVADLLSLSEAPTQVLSPAIDLEESLSDMCTQPYTADLRPINVEGKHLGSNAYPSARASQKVRKTFALICPKKVPTNDDPMNESLSDLATQPYTADLHSPRRELDDSISDIATQPYRGDLLSPLPALARARSACGAVGSATRRSSRRVVARVMDTSNESLSDMMTQPFRDDLPSTPTAALTGERLRGSCVSSDTLNLKSKDGAVGLESLSTLLCSQPKTNENEQDNESVDEDATQLLIDPCASNDTVIYVYNAKDSGKVPECSFSIDCDATTQDLVGDAVDGGTSLSGSKEAAAAHVSYEDRPTATSGKRTGTKVIDSDDDGDNEPLTPTLNPVLDRSPPTPDLIDNDDQGPAATDLQGNEMSRNIKRSSVLQNLPSSPDLDMTPSLNTGKSHRSSQLLSSRKLMLDNLDFPTQDLDDSGSSTTSETLLGDRKFQEEIEDVDGLHLKDLGAVEASENLPDISTGCLEPADVRKGTISPKESHERRKTHQQSEETLSDYNCDLSTDEENNCCDVISNSRKKSPSVDSDKCESPKQSSEAKINVAERQTVTPAKIEATSSKTVSDSLAIASMQTMVTNASSLNQSSTENPNDTSSKKFEASMVPVALPHDQFDDGPFNKVFLNSMPPEDNFPDSDEEMDEEFCGNISFVTDSEFMGEYSSINKPDGSPLRVASAAVADSCHIPVSLNEDGGGVTKTLQEKLPALNSAQTVTPIRSPKAGVPKNPDATSPATVTRAKLRAQVLLVESSDEDESAFSDSSQSQLLFSINMNTLGDECASSQKYGDADDAASALSPQTESSSKRVNPKAKNETPTGSSPNNRGLRQQCLSSPKRSSQKAEKAADSTCCSTPLSNTSKRSLFASEVRKNSPRLAKTSPETVVDSNAIHGKAMTQTKGVLQKPFPHVSSKESDQSKIPAEDSFSIMYFSPVRLSENDSNSCSPRGFIGFKNFVTSAEGSTKPLILKSALDSELSTGCLGQNSDATATESDSKGSASLVEGQHSSSTVSKAPYAPGVLHKPATRAGRKSTASAASESLATEEGASNKIPRKSTRANKRKSPDPITQMPPKAARRDTKETRGPGKSKNVVKGVGLGDEFLSAVGESSSTKEPELDGRANYRAPTFINVQSNNTCKVADDMKQGCTTSGAVEPCNSVETNGNTKISLNSIMKTRTVTIRPTSSAAEALSKLDTKVNENTSVTDKALIRPTSPQNKNLNSDPRDKIIEINSSDVSSIRTTRGRGKGTLSPANAANLDTELAQSEDINNSKQTTSQEYYTSQLSDASSTIRAPKSRKSATRSSASNLDSSEVTSQLNITRSGRTRRRRSRFSPDCKSSSSRPGSRASSNQNSEDLLSELPCEGDAGPTSRGRGRPRKAALLEQGSNAAGSQNARREDLCGTKANAAAGNGTPLDTGEGGSKSPNDTNQSNNVSQTIDFSNHPTVVVSQSTKNISQKNTEKNDISTRPSISTRTSRSKGAQQKKAIATTISSKEDEASSPGMASEADRPNTIIVLDNSDVDTANRTIALDDSNADGDTDENSEDGVQRKIFVQKSSRNPLTRAANFKHAVGKEDGDAASSVCSVSSRLNIESSTRRAAGRSRASIASCTPSKDVMVGRGIPINTRLSLAVESSSRAGGAEKTTRLVSKSNPVRAAAKTTRGRSSNVSSGSSGVIIDEKAATKKGPQQRLSTASSIVEKLDEEETINNLSSIIPPGRPSRKRTLKSAAEPVDESKPMKRTRGSSAVNESVTAIPEELETTQTSPTSSRGVHLTIQSCSPSVTKKPLKKRASRAPLAARREPADLNTSTTSVESFASSVGGRRGRPAASVFATPASVARRLSRLDSPAAGNTDASARQARASLKPRVLFTGVMPDKNDAKTLSRLGGVIVDTPALCSVLVSMGAKRTCKLLACAARGVPVVSLDWLSASVAANAFTDPWQFIVKDVDMEQKFGFDLRKSLQKAGSQRLFEGLTVHATPGVRPDRDQMKELVESGGGSYLPRIPRTAGPGLVVVSCPEDRSSWPPLRHLKIPVVSSEFVLTGILRAEADIKQHLIK